jgi:fatty acid desaturase
MLEPQLEFEDGRSAQDHRTEEVVMLWTIFVILLVLWLLGVVTSYTLGGFIHVLLVIAVIMAVMQLIQGRRAL